MIRFTLKLKTDVSLVQYMQIKDVEDEALEDDIIEHAPYTFIGSGVEIQIDAIRIEEEFADVHSGRPVRESLQWAIDSVIDYGEILTAKQQKQRRFNKPALDTCEPTYTYQELFNMFTKRHPKIAACISDFGPGPYANSFKTWYEDGTELIVRYGQGMDVFMLE